MEMHLSFSLSFSFTLPLVKTSSATQHHHHYYKLITCLYNQMVIPPPYNLHLSYFPEFMKQKKVQSCEEKQFSQLMFFAIHLSSIYVSSESTLNIDAMIYLDIMSDCCCHLF